MMSQQEHFNLNRQGITWVETCKYNPQDLGQSAPRPEWDKKGWELSFLPQGWLKDWENKTFKKD